MVLVPPTLDMKVESEAAAALRTIALNEDVKSYVLENQPLYNALLRAARLRDRGFRSRVYLPYGREWYLYLRNRLSEHPPNVFQAIADVAGSQAV